HGVARSPATNARPRRRDAARSWPPQAAGRVQPPSLARPPLLFRLHAASCISSSRETDDLALGSRSGNTASDRLGSCRRTRNVLSGLVGNEFVEVGVGEHLTWAFRAVPDDNVTERTRSDVTVERLHRAMKLACGLGGRA